MEESTINDNYQGLDVIGDPEGDSENELVNTQDQGGTTYDNTAVEAETDAVAIQINPLNGQEDSAGSGEETGNDKKEKLAGSLKDCSLFDEDMEDKGGMVNITLAPDEDENYCLLTMAMAAEEGMDDSAGMAVSGMECKVPKGSYTPESLDQYLQDNYPG